MAASLQFHILSCCIFLAYIAQSYHLPNALVLPVTKDVATLQYVTKIHHGTPLVPMKLVVDLGGPIVWLDCASGFVSSSSRVIPSCSIQCSIAKANSRFTHGNNTCDLLPENSITLLATRGELVEDIVAIQSMDRSRKEPVTTTVHQFLFSCAPTFLLQGLSSDTKGMLGLGRKPIALPSQLATTIGFHRKFTICLSSSKGVVLSGNKPNNLIFGPKISNSLMYTPLVTNQGGTGMSHEYFIKVKSIKINGKHLSLGKSLGGTKLSTIVPYTTMESSIYATFTKAYMEVAISMNMTRVASVAPFGLCFGSKSEVVPIIDLVLQSEMVKWRLYGNNSVVPVSNEVMCLGFLDGGLNPRTSIVIGGFQLEDFLLEFDLGTSMLGFSSLLTRQTSCSSMVFSSMVKESL